MVSGQWVDYHTKRNRKEMQVELSCRTREELHTTSAILKFQAQLRTSRTRSISAKWMEIRRCEIVNWPCHATFDYCFPVTCGSIVVAPSFEFRFKIKFSALSVVSVGSQTIVFQWGWDSGTWRLEQRPDTDRLTKPHCRLVCVSFLLFFFTCSPSRRFRGDDFEKDDDKVSP